MTQRDDDNVCSFCDEPSTELVEIWWGDRHKQNGIGSAQTTCEKHLLLARLDVADTVLRDSYMSFDYDDPTGHDIIDEIDAARDLLERLKIELLC
jgi:hypothetical protein